MAGYGETLHRLPEAGEIDEPEEAPARSGIIRGVRESMKGILLPFSSSSMPCAALECAPVSP
jgi:hypothetical protein